MQNSRRLEILTDALSFVNSRPDERANHGACIWQRGGVWVVWCMVLYSCMVCMLCMGLYGCMTPEGRRDNASLMYGAIQLYDALYELPDVWHQMTR